MKNIILASNGKKSCRSAEEHALLECKKHGATLSIVHVVDCGLEHYGQVDQLATEIDKAGFISYVRAVSRKEAENYFVPLVKRARQDNIDVTLYLEDGGLAETLARFDAGADLVIIGGKRPLFCKKTTRFRALSKRLNCPVRQVA